MILCKNGIEVWGWGGGGVGGDSNDMFALITTASVITTNHGRHGTCRLTDMHGPFPGSCPRDQ